MNARSWFAASGVLTLARLSVLFRCAAALWQRLTRQIEGDACLKLKRRSTGWGSERQENLERMTGR
jgi:hypothetical protein